MISLVFYFSQNFIFPHIFTVYVKKKSSSSSNTVVVEPNYDFLMARYSLIVLKMALINEPNISCHNYRQHRHHQHTHGVIQNTIYTLHTWRAVLFT